MFPPSTWSRRGLGVAAIGLLGVGGLCAGVLHLPAAAPGYRLLSAEEIDQIEVLAAALFPTGALPVGGGDGETAPRVDRLLGDELDPSAAAPFRHVLQALSAHAQLVAGAPLGDLSADAARSLFSTWSDPHNPPRRLAAESIKAVLGLAFFRRPDVIAAIGWKRGCGA
jgi:hypothetical protein